MRLDDFVFDSQFTFLGKQEALGVAYQSLVLSKAQQESLAGLTAYIRAETWDSTRMGKNIGRLLWLENNVQSTAALNEVLALLGRFDCCFVRLHASHSFCRHASSLQPLSRKAVQQLSLYECRPASVREIEFQRYSAAQDGAAGILQEICRISESSFCHGRFREDKHFSDELVNDIYRSWVISEASNEQSDLYYVVDGDQVAAFLLYKKNISPLPEEQVGFVSLVASPPEFAGRGYATSLLNYVIQTARRDGASHIVANTNQRSQRALDFFARNGFQMTATLNEYHVWREAET